MKVIEFVKNGMITTEEVAQRGIQASPKLPIGCVSPPSSVPAWKFFYEKFYATKGANKKFAMEKKPPPQIVMQNYGMERFLERVAHMTFENTPLHSQSQTRRRRTQGQHIPPSATLLYQLRQSSQDHGHDGGTRRHFSAEGLGRLRRVLIEQP